MKLRRARIGSMRSYSIGWSVSSPSRPVASGRRKGRKMTNINIRVAAAQKCVDLRAFAALDPVYGVKFGNLILELARIAKGDGSIWIAPETMAARLGVSRATFYRIAAAAAAAGLISPLARSRVGTRVRVYWHLLGPVFSACEA